MATRLQKRADGRYCKQITIGLQNGKPVKKSFYGKTIKEVEKKVRDFEVLRDKGIIIENTNLTILEFAKEYCSLKKAGKSYKSQVGYNTQFNIINHYLSCLKVKDTREYHIQVMINEICADGNLCKANKILRFLKELFNYACSLDIIYKNPCTNINIQYKAKEKRQLTELEKRKITRAELNFKDRAFVFMLLYTGMRRGEIFALSPSDINFNTMTIHISKTVIDFNGKAILQEHTKTSAGMRIVPIFNPLIEPLKVYFENVTGDILFPNARGAYYSSSSIDYYWKSLKKKIGINNDVTPHLFRHNFISECYNANISVKLIQKWVGHSDVQTTLNIYTHINEKLITDTSVMNSYYSQSKISQNQKNKGLDVV